MGKIAVPEGDRWQIIAFSKLKYSYSRIDKIMKVSRFCLTNTIRNYMLTGCVKHKVRFGRPRKTTAREDSRLFSLSRNSPFTSTRRLVLLQTRQDKPIGSKSLVNRRLLDMGLASFNAISKPLISKRVKETRLNWCLEKRNWTFSKWSNVILVMSPISKSAQIQP